jgi:hypothetical protein
LSVFIAILLEDFAVIREGCVLLWRRSNYSSTGHEIEDEHDNRENQKDVNPSTQCVTADESYDPEDEENNRNCPKHFVLLNDAGVTFPGSQMMYAVLAATCGKVPGTRRRLPARIK